MKTRINHFLSAAGVASRRKSDELIASGKVLVNGKMALLGQTIDPETDEVVCEGKPVTISNSLIYYALYKPKNVVSTKDDELGRETVMSYIPENPPVYPVGRLDRDSEGLILLTNDGELTNVLTHPKYEHQKQYLVYARVRKGIDFDETIAMNSFLRGTRIEGHMMKADKAKVISKNESMVQLEVVLHTGYNRQVRKMCDKIGLVVTKLVRTRFANIDLSDLKLEPGEYKQIDKESILG